MPAIKSTALEDVNAESNRPGVSDSGQMARIEDSDRRRGLLLARIQVIEGDVTYG